MYSNLPPHLKTCLLYLNIYPEDYVIRKDDLVKQWVAEGFLGVEGSFGTQKYQGNTVDKEDVAGRYFDELVERKMIQPADINYNRQVLSCTVSHSVLDFIIQKSMEENFITAINYPEKITGHLDKVRRLSLKFGGAKIAQVPSNLTVCHVRSLMFSGFFKCVPPLMEYWLLRVLILDIWSDQEEILDLALIGELFQLRNIKIECNMTIKLPAVIRRLKYLQTLDVAAQVATFPSDIYCLKHLWHLRLPTEHYLSHARRINHMTSFLSGSSYNVRELVKLANLHDLHLTFSAVPSSYLARDIEWLVSCPWECSKLKSLILDCEVPLNKTISCSSWTDDVFSPPDHLEKLVLSPRIFIMSRLHKLIGRLNNLCTLKIAVRELTIGDVGILQQLASLAALSLHVRATPEERIVFTNGFDGLKYFKFTCTALCVEFTRGTMPNVQRLKLSFNANTMQQYRPEDAGIGNLGGLKVISAKIGAASADQTSREAAKCRLVEAFVYNHPSRHFLKGNHPQSHSLEENHPQLPIRNIQMVDWIIHDDTEHSSADVIMRGPDDEYIIEETETMEDFNRIADTPPALCLHVCRQPLLALCPPPAGLRLHPCRPCRSSN
uniref:NB-ARC domain-containing protein n=1 Tax=Setaria viridis TaxID=4556 RepID=A0A4U6TMY7_SETVI|nr:hypothetical protein SEVIR_8G249811v2 [Setaria viridis]